MIAAVLSRGEVLVAAAYLAVLVGAAVAAGLALATRFGGDDRLDRAVVAALGAVLHPLLIGLVLGAVGLLVPVAVALVSAITGTLALVWSRSRPADRDRTRPSGEVVAAAALAAGFFVLALGVGYGDGPSLHHESSHYHFAAVAQFAEEGSIWPELFQNPAVFTASHPGDAELLSAEVALATDTDQLIYGWLFPVSALLGVLSAAAIARELKGRPAVGVVAALATLLSPFGFFGAHSIGNDLLAVVGVTTGLALVLRARQQETIAPLLLGGAALGLALGTKYTALLPSVVVVLGAAVLLARGAASSTCCRDWRCSPARGSCATGSSSATPSTRRT